MLIYAYMHIIVYVIMHTRKYVSMHTLMYISMNMVTQNETEDEEAARATNSTLEEVIRKQKVRMQPCLQINKCSVCICICV